MEVDRPKFIDLDTYPIWPTVKYVKPENAILECGFGGGRIIRHLINSGCTRTVGIEYDIAAVRRLAKVQPAQLVAGDIRFLPFPDDYFDVTLCFGLLGCLESDLDKALKEVVRVTRRDGIIVASFMLDNLARLAQKIVNEIAPSNRKMEPRFYGWMDSIEGWRGFLRARGLSVIETSLMLSRYIYYYWTPLLRQRGHKFDHAFARVCDRGLR